MGTKTNRHGGGRGAAFVAVMVVVALLSPITLPVLGGPSPVAAEEPPAPAVYAITDLGALGASYAWALNDRGDVVGGLTNGNGYVYRPIANSAGAITDLHDALPFAISNDGTVFGQGLGTGAGGTARAVTPDGKTAAGSSLFPGQSTPPAPNIIDPAYGTNVSVPGVWTQANGWNALYDDGCVLPGLKGGTAVAINSAGALAGQGILGGAGYPLSGVRGVALKCIPDAAHPGSYDAYNLAPTGGPAAGAFAISHNGTVAGKAQTGETGPIEAYRWEGQGPSVNAQPLGTFAGGHLPPPGGSQSAAYGINDADEIVGSYGPDASVPYLMVGDPRDRAFIYEDEFSGMEDLNDLIDSNSGWVLNNAFDINNRGQIVGQGTHNGALRGFLLTPIGDVNITADRIVVTQVVQNEENLDLLVAKKSTYAILRAHTDTRTAQNVHAVLRGYRGGQHLGEIEPERTPIDVHQTPDPYSATESFIFSIPLGWTSAGSLRLEAHVNDDLSVLETKYTDNEPPPATVTFQQSGSIKILVVDTYYESNHVLTGNAEAFTRLRNAMRQQLPVAGGDLEITHAWYPLMINEPHVAPGSNDGCGQVLDQLKVIHDTLDLDSHTLIYGLVPANPDGTRPYGNDTTNGCAYRNSLVQTGWTGPGGEATAVHEFIHAVGRQHTPSCTAPGSNPDPYPPDPSGDAHISMGSLHRSQFALAGDHDIAFDRSTLTFLPDNASDIMTYCRPRYMSDYTWENVFGLITHTVPAHDIPSPGIHADVSGTIDLVDESADLSLSELLPGASNSSNEPGPYHLEFYDGTTKVSDTPFSGSELDQDAGAERPTLGFSVPVYIPANVDRIAIFSDQSGHQLVSKPVPAGAAPTISITNPGTGAVLPASGPVSVAWTSHDDDGDPLTHTVLYRPTTSSPWMPIAKQVGGSSATIDAANLPGSNNGTIRVVVSDGFFTRSDEVTGLVVPIKVPVVTIEQPAAGTSVTTKQDVMLSGLADGVPSSLPDSAYEWSSDRDGVLGTGPSVLAQTLSVGTHHVQLRVTVPGGPAGVATTNLVVRKPADVVPKLAVSRSELSFVGDATSPAGAQSFDVFDESGGALDWTAASNDPRVHVSAPSGTTSATLAVTADTSGLLQGESFGAAVTINRVGDSQPPIVIPVDVRATSAVADVSPVAIDFGRRAIGATGAPRTVTFTNHGRTSITIGAAALAGAAPDQYARSNDHCSNATLATAQSCTVDVAYQPDSPGRRPAYLVLADANSSAQWYVSLTGLAAHHFTSSVVAWGNNDNGQLGSTTSELCDQDPNQLAHACSSVPVAVPGLSDVVQLAVGAPSLGLFEGSHSLALKADGTVWAWGANKLGELGNGTRDLVSFSDAAPHPTPAQVPGLSDVSAIAAGWHYSMALKSDGTVWVWGAGALGNGTTAMSTTPVQVKGPNGVGFLNHVVAIAAGERNGGGPTAYALKDDGTVWAWGYNAGGYLGNDANNGLYPGQVVGANGQGFLTDVIKIASRTALKRDGTVWTWGPQAGLGTYLWPAGSTSTPVQVVTDCHWPVGGGLQICQSPLTGISAIASDGFERFALDNNGKVWAWGTGNIPGDPWTDLGLATASWIPVFAQPVLAPGGLGTISNVTMMTAGQAVTSDGSVLGWGYNPFGVVGVGNLTTQAAPRRVLGVGGTGFLSDVTQIAGGIDHRLAIVSASAGGTTTLSAGAPATVNAHAGDAIETVVGSFDDSAESRAFDFSATIDWGDGSEPSGATVTGPDGGPYLVHGTHMYSDPGSHDITIDVLGRSGASITLTSSASIGAATLTGLPGDDVSFVAGAPATTSVGAFTSSNPGSTESSFSATVNWGDGSATVPATVTGPPGGPFAVVGPHTYRRAGTYPLAIHASDGHGGAVDFAGRAVVTPASLTAGDTVSIDFGTSAAFSGRLANFIDGNPLSVAGDYAARIDWGDGTQSNGAVGGPTGGPYTVDGAHTYANDDPRTVTVTLTGPAGASATATATLFTQRSAIDVQSSVAPGSGIAPLNSTFTYSVRNRGIARLWSVAVDTTSCGTATYVSGDNANGSLDPGETWTYTCAHTFNTNGTFTDISWASAYALTDGAPIRSQNASADVKVGDTTAPVVTVTGVTDGATYAAGAVPTAGCNTVDPTPSSGIATNATPTTTGGPTNFTVTCAGATDVAGNAGNTAVARYTVRVSMFTFSGFLTPVRNRPTVNSVKAGSSVPVKFSLGGDKGLAIFAAGYPKSEQFTCPPSATVNGIDQTVNAGNSSLSYDRKTMTYTYTWKTDTAWKNTCRQLVLTFTDGTAARADFTFSK